MSRPIETLEARVHRYAGKLSRLNLPWAVFRAPRGGMWMLVSMQRPDLYDEAIDQGWEFIEERAGA